MPCSRFVGLVLAVVPAAAGCAAIAGLESPVDGQPADTMSGTVPAPGSGRCAAARVETDVGAVDFGEVRVNGATPAVSAVSLRNVGVAAVTLLPVVTGGAGTFGVTTPEIAVGPGETRVVQIAFAPAGLGRHEARLDFATKGATCNALASVALAGAGSDSVVLVQPGMVDFGAVDCGAEAPAKAVLLRSDAAQSVSFTANVTGSFFALDKAIGTLAPGGTTTLMVTPGAAPNQPGAKLVETLSLLLPATRTVKLQLEARGVLLAISPTDLTVEKDASKKVTVKNLGNRTGAITFRSYLPWFRLEGASFTLDPGASASFDVAFAPAFEGTQTTTPTVEVAGAALCGRDPLVLTGKSDRD